MKKIFLSLVVSLFCLAFVQIAKSAQSEVVSFDSAEQEAAYYQVINQLRCPKCENQTIADSDAGIAKDLRYVVYQKVLAGDSEQVIMRYMQKRYGDFVLYDPPIKPVNYVLWFLPLVIFIIIFIIVIAKVGRRKPMSED